MEEVQIQTSSKTYPVFIANGVVKELPTFIKRNFPSITSVLIMTDQNVGERYLSSLIGVLSDFHPSAYTVPNGEKAKTFAVYEQCLTYLLEKKLDRKSLLLAFGGGAVGDLAGFVAATYMRGIPFIQIPTTILAHDSAVGGKVAINHPLGKNMVGAFYQPEAVFYDLNFLHSLPLHERRSGFAEVIKHGLIRDEQFLNWLMGNIHSLENLSEDGLSYMLKTGIRIKGSIVSEDEKETGIRAFLNFGHTLGHAIEGEAGYGQMTHGEAVLIGMLFALRLSKQLRHLSIDMDNLIKWLNKLGYRTEIPTHLNHKKLIDRMKQDKKSVAGQVQFVLLDRIGHPVLQKIDDKYLLQQLQKGGN